MYDPDRKRGPGWSAHLALGLLLLLPCGLSGQEPPDTLRPPGVDSLPVEAAPPPPTARDTVAALVVSPRPRGAAVATALVFPVGSGSDPEGASGAASLLVRALENELRRELAGGAALVQGTAEAGTLSIGVVKPPEEREAAWSAIRRILFETPLSDAAVDAARSELLGPLRFERGAPVRLFELEFARLTLGVTHPWARPVQGTESGLESVTGETVRELQRRWLRMEDAYMALVGPVEPADLTGVVMAAPGPGAPPAPPAPGTAGGSRVLLEREVVNAWVAVAWPASPEASRTDLEFAAHMIQAMLTPNPPDPALFSVTSRVEDLPGGPWLRVIAAVDPDQAERWEQRVLSVVSGLADAAPAADFLTLFRRRFAADVLLPEGNPEVEAVRLARDLLRGTGPRELAAEVQDLDASRVQAVIRSLGEPRVLLYGPPETGGGAPAPGLLETSSMLDGPSRP